MRDDKEQYFPSELDYFFPKRWVRSTIFEPRMRNVMIFYYNKNNFYTTNTTFRICATFLGFRDARHCQSYFVPATIRLVQFPSRLRNQLLDNGCRFIWLRELFGRCKQSTKGGDYPRHLMERVRYGMVCL